MHFKVTPSKASSASLTVPGDKSVSHRALMLGSIADGQTNVTGFLPGEDCLATMAAMRELGVTINQPSETEVSIEVFQGESRRVEENTKLGRVLLSGIRAAPRGEIKVRVTFEIDTDGLLGVSARNEESGEAQVTRIQLTGGLDEDQVNDPERNHTTEQVGYVVFEAAFSFE